MLDSEQAQVTSHPGTPLSFDQLATASVSASHTKLGQLLIDASVYVYSGQVLLEPRFHLAGLLRPLALGIFLSRASSPTPYVSGAGEVQDRLAALLVREEVGGYLPNPSFVSFRTSVHGTFY